MNRVRRIRNFLSQPFFVAEAFQGVPGRYVHLSETLDSFERILNGEGDNMPEAAFMYVGTFDDAVKKAKVLEEKASQGK